MVQDVDSQPHPDEPSSSDLLSGSTLGPFHIVGLLGKGGMATVYEAYDSSLERAIALKVLPPEFLHDESFAKRFRQEGLLVARLEHPNVVPIYSSGIDEGIAWMSMRLLSGGSLGTLLRRERPTPRRVVEILRPVADALDYAHARGVIHRDIKPANILFDETDHVCVADFGLASIRDFNGRQTRTRTIAGTPQYMAPEVSLGKDLDHRSDIYSLGVVAYEMLSGDLPFTADGPMAILLKHVNENPPSPSTVPAPLLRAVHKALSKNPAERWASAGAFVAAMENAVRAGPSGRRSAGRQWIAIAAGALTVAAAGGLIWREQRQSLPASAAAAVSAQTLRPEPVVVVDSVEPTPPVVREPRRVVRTRPAENRVTPPAVVSPVASESSNSRAVDTLPTAAAPIDISEPQTTIPAGPRETNPPAPVAAFAPPVERVLSNDVLVQPVRVRTVAAQYPPVARAAQIVGNVLLRATIGVDGSVTDVAVVRSVHPLLDQAARQAVLQYVYTPAMRNTVPEVVTVEITVSFRLE